MNQSVALTPYQRLVIAILAFLQFTVVLDFMILSPLGAVLLKELSITTEQFGLVVSAYAFSAGASGLLAAGFADRFDRKRLLLFFYGGFVVGTLLCGIATSYAFLLVARIVTGLFGGVIGSISFAIIADLFPFETRGRVMGTVQTAFAASQVLGLPVGLYLSNHFGWHAPFLMIVGVSLAVGAVMVARLQPITVHLVATRPTDPFAHILRTLARPRYLWGFGATTLLATGGFMLMPFGSAFSVNNLGISLEQLPVVYMATGLASVVGGPVIGRLSDSIGKYTMFVIASLVAMAVIVTYCRLGVTPMWLVIAISIVLFWAVTGRMIAAQALSSAIPHPTDRGAYMAITSSLQQLSGGLAAMLAGLIVTQTASGRLEHYEHLGYVVAGAILVTMVLMYKVNGIVREKLSTERSVVAVDVLTQVVIDCARDRVAAYAADPSNAPEWYVNIEAVEWLTAPPVVVGSQLAFVAHFLGRRLAYTYEVVELVPGERLVMRTAQGPFPMETTYAWAAAGAKSTRMTLRNRGAPSGFSKVVAPIMAAAMRRANRKDLDRLKAILETQGSDSADEAR